MRMVRRPSIQAGETSNGGGSDGAPMQATATRPLGGMGESHTTRRVAAPAGAVTVRSSDAASMTMGARQGVSMTHCPAGTSTRSGAVCRAEMVKRTSHSGAVAGSVSVPSQRSAARAAPPRSAAHTDARPPRQS